MNIQGVKSHLQRLSYQLSALELGARRYRFRGFFANRMATHFQHEPYMSAVLQRTLEGRRGAFVDIGANIGQTLIKVLAIDPKRAYVGFEPQVSCCFFIHQFISDNALRHARIVPMALSDTNGMCELFSNGNYDEMASIAGDTEVSGRPRSVVTTVPSRIGDEALEEIGIVEIAAIKIDVEGAELRVLSGLQKTLSRSRPTVIFEVLPNFHGRERIRHDAATCERNRAEAAAIFALFSRLGYTVCQIDDSGRELAIGRFELDDRENYIGFNFVAHARS